MDKKRVLLTGAAGFLGYSVINTLIMHGFEVYAIVRPHSPHNKRINNMTRVHIIECDMSEFEKLSNMIDEQCDVFIHLAWHGNRYNMSEQMINVEATLKTVDVAKKLGCRRYICTGSQAEYGPTKLTQREDTIPKPICAYGSAKVAACYLSKNLAQSYGLEWVWGRIFSLIGRFEPSGRMLPDLYYTLNKGEKYYMSSGRQNWDYLDVADAAEAILALSQRGCDGEIYNIAHGSYRQLREYTQEVYEILGRKGEIIYGEDPEPYISLQPSIEKIKKDTGWKPKKSFKDSISDY